MNPSELKQLQSRRSTALAALQELKKEQRALSVRTQTLVKYLDETNAQLEAATQDVVVSEHAVLRYLERVDGVEIDAIAKRIADAVRPIVAKIGDGDIPLGNGVRAIVRNKCVVTVKPV